MDIKCLHPVILINPEARKKALDFDRIYIRERCQCWIMETFVLEPWQYSPKKWSIKLSDIEHCYLLNSETGDMIPFISLSLVVLVLSVVNVKLMLWLLVLLWRQRLLVLRLFLLHLHIIPNIYLKMNMVMKHFENLIYSCFLSVYALFLIISLSLIRCAISRVASTALKPKDLIIIYFCGVSFCAF